MLDIAKLHHKLSAFRNMEAVTATDLPRYDIAAVLHGTNYVTNLNFHESGNHLVMGTDNSIHLIDALTGEEKKKVFVKTHGVGKLKYTHHDMCVIVSSSKRNNDIRYLSLYDNKYLRYFCGHTAKVTSISMSPDRDMFLSAAMDRTVCLWELNNNHPLARLKLDSNDLINPVVSYDYSGAVVGVMCSKEVAGGIYNERFLKLYDSRKLDDGPFSNIAPTTASISVALTNAGITRSEDAERHLVSQWTDLEFSPDGKHVLISTSSGMVLVVDGYNGNNQIPIAICQSGALSDEEVTPLSSPACFSPDSKFIFSGSADNSIQVSDRLSGRCLTNLRGHASPVKVLTCNPAYDMMASACVATALWLPVT
jgi:COMPASS component SWD2